MPTLSLITDASGNTSGMRIAQYQLEVTRGPDKRKRQMLGDRRVLLGTGERAHFLLTDPTVSALHCEIVATPAGFFIHDLGSKNGVRLGSRRVKEIELAPGDVLSLGATEVRFKQLETEETHALPSRTQLGDLRGFGPVMREVIALLERAAKADTAVLLQGETGTGKSLAAEVLIAQSARREAALSVIECGSLSPTLVESELFGTEKGAFTGASEARPGAFERAQGGTVVLDQIDELSIDLQTRLLAVLERKEVQRLGATQTIPLDIRVVAISQKDLRREVNGGRFRADLYYRLSGLEIRMPPLRERREDIPSLVEYFISQRPDAKPLPAATLEALAARDYPGNLRELQNVVERLSQGFPVEPSSSTPESAWGAIDLAIDYRTARERVVTGFEQRYFTAMLSACRNNLSEVARRAGLSRVHLYSTLGRLGLQPKRGKPSQ